uniref:Uncharacterized protein n=1 Tax=Rhizophora mucronata TaxID=61149 RepID=A0A2P2IL97_RHIMU
MSLRKSKCHKTCSLYLQGTTSHNTKL